MTLPIIILKTDSTLDCAIYNPPSPLGGVMARIKKSGIAWLFVLALPLAWCGRGADKEAEYSTPAPLPVASAVQDKPVPPQANDPAPIHTLYALSGVNIRESASTSSPVIGQVPKGGEVISNHTSDGWHLIHYKSVIGWIRSDLLSDQPHATPLMAAPPLPAMSAPSSERPAVRQQTRKPERPSSGGQARAPRRGRCECPYDVMRNGKLCGGRSAYSRPGGHKPRCYN